METASSSKTSAKIHQTTRCHFLEDCKLDECKRQHEWPKLNGETVQTDFEEIVGDCGEGFVGGDLLNG
jgi:hypothetical protein